jgi:hypothetical protein
MLRQKSIDLLRRDLSGGLIPKYRLDDAGFNPVSVNGFAMFRGILDGHGREMPKYHHLA